MTASSIPLVSVIIPLHNAEKYIAECIKSVLNQTWKNIEIIVIDDGSTDNSLNVAKQFEADGVIVFSQKNKGASAARNKGIAEAKGEYIQFLDADDLLSNNKIECQLRSLDGPKDKLSISKTVHFLDDTNNIISNDVKNEWYNHDFSDPVDFLKKLNAGWEVMHGYGGMVAVHAWLTPKNVIERAGFWNENLTVDDDGEFFCRVLLSSRGIVYSKEGINYYRKYKESASLSSTNNKKALSSRLLAIDLKLEHLKSYIPKALLDKIFARYYWEIGVDAYPTYKDVSKNAIKKAKALNYNGPKYRSGKLATALSNIIGWKTVKLASTYIHNKKNSSN